MVRNANRGFPEDIVSKEYLRTPVSVCLIAFAHVRYSEQRRRGNGVRVTMHSPPVKSTICDLRPPGLLDRSSFQIHRLSPISLLPEDVPGEAWKREKERTTILTLGTSIVGVASETSGPGFLPVLAGQRCPVPEHKQE